VLTRYPIGLAATAVALAVAGWRLSHIFRLVASGRPAPDRLKPRANRARIELQESSGNAGC